MSTRYDRLMAEPEDGSSPLAEALARVGDRWTLLVVEALLPGPRRFNDLLGQIPGIAPNILSERLKRLEREALLVARPYSGSACLAPQCASRRRAGSSPGRSACWRTGGPGTPTRRTPPATPRAAPPSRPAGTARRATSSLTASRATQRCTSCRRRLVQSAAAGRRADRGQSSAASRRRPSSAYSTSRSLTDRPRCSALAESRSDSAIGMTPVRRTQSSLSHSSPVVSDTLPPSGRSGCRLLLPHVRAQDAVAQQAKAAQVRKARPLSEAGDRRQVQRRAQAGDRQIELNPPFELGAGERAAEQPLEPASLEADRDDDEVVGDTFALAAVLDRDDHLPLAGVDRRRPPGERAKAARGVQDRLGLLGEHAAVGALKELAPV